MNLGKIKHLDDSKVELFGVTFRNKGEDLRAQAFVLKILFVFNIIVAPLGIFDNISWIQYIVNHASMFNIIIILLGEALYYLYVKFVSKKVYEDHEQYKHVKKS